MQMRIIISQATSTWRQRLAYKQVIESTSTHSSHWRRTAEVYAAVTDIYSYIRRICLIVLNN